MVGGDRKKYIITADGIPKFLILHIKRFTKNNFFVEKNPTIVNFPVKNLEMKDCELAMFALSFLCDVPVT